MILLYSLKAGIALAVVFLLYRLLLSRLTFYRVNRCFLIGASLLSLLAPLLHTRPVLPTSYTYYVESAIAPATQPMQKAPPIVASQAAPRIAPQPDRTAATSLFGILLLAGMAFMLIRLVLQARSLRKVRKRATLINEEERILLYSTWEPTIPFSFGRSIYVHPSSYEVEDLRRIVEHETVHIRERHWADILFFQTLLILQWWNPAVWILDRDARQNLEFLADKAVLEQGADRKHYQYLLLKVSGLAAPPLCNGFNFSSLKNRIVMMNKQSSSRLQGLRFLFVLPLLFLLLSALRRHPASDHVFHFVGFAVDAKTLTTLDGVVITEKSTGLSTKTDPKGFFRLDIPYAESFIDKPMNLTAKKEGRMSAPASFNVSPKFPYSGSLFLIALPILKDTAGRNLPFSYGISLYDTAILSPTPDIINKSLAQMVDMVKTDRKVAIANQTTDKIYYLDGNTAYILDGRGFRASMGGPVRVLINDTLVLSGDEVNRRYKRNQIARIDALQADSIRKLTGIGEAMFSLQMKPSPTP